MSRCLLFVSLLLWACGQTTTSPSPWQDELTPGAEQTVDDPSSPTGSSTAPGTSTSSTSSSTKTTNTNTNTNTETGTTDTEPVDTGPPPDRFTVVAFGDQGTGDANQQAVADAVVAYCASEGCDRVLTLGDNIYNSGVVDIKDPLFESAFEQPYAKITQPIYISLGNHDHAGNVDAMVAYSKISSKWHLPARYYSEDNALVFLAAADTDRMDNDSDQARALITALETSKAPWKVVFGHHPLRSNGIHGDAGTDRGGWLRQVLCDRASLFLAGHDHNLQYLADDCRVGLFVSGGGGRSLYSVTTESNTLFAAQSWGFLALHFTEQDVLIHFVDPDGTLLYESTRKITQRSSDCGEDGVCNQDCSSDLDCADFSCVEDSVCEPACTADPDCWGSCSCDTNFGICETLVDDSTTPCGCDPSCGGYATPCGLDGECDEGCPKGIDPDC